MMSLRAPFGRICGILQIYGFYGSASRRLKVLKLLAYLLLTLTGSVLNISAICQVENGIDAVNIFISAPIFIMVHVYSIHYLKYQKKITSFLYALQEISEEDRLSKTFMDRAYFYSAKYNFYLVSLLLIPGLAVASLFPLFTGKNTLVLWQANKWIDHDVSFAIIFIYEIILFFHTGMIFVIFLELFIHPLVIINGYSEYCEHKLARLNHEPLLTSSTIKDCVQIHQKLIELQKKFNELFAIPLLLQAFLSAYTNCSLIYLLTVKV
jgi:hypothetical protein